jgi:hypothetical protein
MDEVYLIYQFCKCYSHKFCLRYAKYLILVLFVKQDPCCMELGEEVTWRVDGDHGDDDRRHSPSTFIIMDF